MNMKRTRSLRLIIIALLLLLRPAAAQYSGFFGGDYNNDMSALMATGAWSRVYLSSLGKTGNSTTARQSSTPSQPAKVTNTTSVKFRITGTHIKTQALAESLASTPAEREQYQKLMDAVLDSFGPQAQKTGYPNDLAAAF